MMEVCLLWYTPDYGADEHFVGVFADAESAERYIATAPAEYQKYYRMQFEKVRKY